MLYSSCIEKNVAYAVSNIQNVEGESNVCCLMLFIVKKLSLFCQKLTHLALHILNLMVFDVALTFSLSFNLWQMFPSRCGHEFCYTCGAEWKNKEATCTCPLWDEEHILDDEDEDNEDEDYDYFDSSEEDYY